MNPFVNPFERNNRINHARDTIKAPSAIVCAVLSCLDPGLRHPYRRTRIETNTLSEIAEVLTIMLVHVLYSASLVYGLWKVQIQTVIYLV